LQLVYLVFVLGFCFEGGDCPGHTEQAVTLGPQLVRQTHGLALVEGSALYPNGTAGAASISAGEGKWVSLLFEALQDVLTLWDVVGDGATLLAPVNGDPVAGTHKALPAVPCYILICPI
jgi:hypothetical protein